MPLLPLRRSHPRYPISKIILYRYEGKEFLTLTLDLGLDGMKIKTHHYFPKGEHLDFKLVLGSNSISLKGQTVYNDLLPNGQPFSYIRFIESSCQSWGLLQEYLGTLRDR